MQSKREYEVSVCQRGVRTSTTCAGSGGPWRPGTTGEVGAGAAIRHSNLPFPRQLWCERVNPENKAALEAWVRETGVRLVQVNGQRKYGGPPPGTLAQPFASWGAALASTSPLGEAPTPSLQNQEPLTTR